MTVNTNMAPNSPAELLGDAHPLLEQIGLPDEVIVAVDGATPDFARIRDLPSLRAFLADYRTRVLVPIELPAIVSGYQYASRAEARELVALDQRLASDPALREFAAASCRVGQRQLGKLRPMRDQRLVQRYLAAIEAGEAHGWHTLVYGASLAVFSLPLRQGMQNYVEKTTQGFIDRAARVLRLPQSTCDELALEHLADAPQTVAHAIGTAGTTLQVV